MVLRVLLLAVVVVTPTAFAAEKQRMVVLNLTASDKSLQPLAESTSELVSTELSDVATMLGVERQRQLLGCAKDGTRPSETRRE
jgi:predicted oxidoreductase (fatty acid repression mutant protein)